VALRSLALKALATTDTSYLSVAAHNEYVFDKTPALHHLEMLEQEVDALYHRQNTIILEPRGAAKTTQGNTGFLSWVIARFPRVRIGLVSNTSTQADAFSRAIRLTVEGNPRYRELYGNLVSSTKWTNSEWIRADSGLEGTKDATVFAVGVGGAIISKRFDLLFLDDILDKENTRTPEQRAEVEFWFEQTLRPCLESDGVVIALGTRWAAEDLYEKLMTPLAEGGKGWKALVRSALLRDDATGEEYSYWPGHWPASKLKELRAEMGSAMFACAYQNDITGLMSGDIFRRENLGQSFKTLPEGHTYSIKMGIDLASSEKERADFTARAVTACDMCDRACGQRGDYFVLSVYRDRRESGHAEFVLDGYTAYPAVSLVLVESQQFQSTLIQTVMEDYPFIPIEGRKTDTDKVTRARAVAAKTEAHKMWFHESLYEGPFMGELLSFPTGHDDMIDALGFSMDFGGDGFTFGSVRAQR
jgi:predicted phage terminase large subunit-like protein